MGGRRTGDDEVRPIRRHIRERATRPRVIKLRARIRRRVLLQKRPHSLLLIRRDAEDIREPAAGEDDLLAGALGVEDGRVGVHLRGADGGDEGAAGGEGGVEAGCVEGFGAVGGEADVVEAGDAEVAGAVEDGCLCAVTGFNFGLEEMEERRGEEGGTYPCETDLAVLRALPDRGAGGDGHFVLTVRDRDDVRRLQIKCIRPSVRQSINHETPCVEKNIPQ